MRRPLTALACLLAAVPATGQVIDAGVGDWSSLPVAETRGRAFLSTGLIDRIVALGREGSCTVPGLGSPRVALDLPIALQFDAQGRIERIVVRDVGCRQLESLIGQGVAGMAAAGEYRPTRGPGWYRSSISFQLQ